MCITLPMIASAQQNLWQNLVSISLFGDLTYQYRHAVGSADSIVGYSVGGTKDIYYKLAPTFTTHEADSVTMAADSAVIITAGDYEIHCWLQVTTAGANDKIRIKLYENGIPSPTTLGRWIINSDGSSTQSETKYFMWYIVGAAVGDKFSIRAANITGNRAVFCTDLKLYVVKMPEKP